MSSLYVVDEADFVFLSRQTGLTAGNFSSHMARLEAADYVTINKTFVDKRPRTTYALTDTGRTAFETYRQQVNALLAD
jgi:DNA-binding MarR family transcriptional regulator